MIMLLSSMGLILISFESQTYAFAYDDVFDQSSTIQANRLEKTRITVGGFYNVQGH